MDTGRLNISSDLPTDNTAKIAELYFDIFNRKLTSVLGRRDAVGIIADHINIDRILVACDDKEVVGIAALKYNRTGFFAPTRH